MYLYTHWFILLLLCVLVSTGRTEENIVLSGGEWPPYVSSKLRYKGVTPRLISDIFAEIGVKVTYRFNPWARSMEDARQGLVDGTFLWYKTADREQDFYISEQPIGYISFVFFHLRDKVFDWRSFDDLKGVRVGATIGYNYGEPFMEMEQKGKLHVIRSKSDLQNLRMLLKGRIDIFPHDLTVGYYEIHNTFSKKEASLFTHHSKALQNKGAYLMLSKKSIKNKEWIGLFDEALTRFIKQGKFRQYYEDDLEKNHYSITAKSSNKNIPEKNEKKEPAEKQKKTVTIYVDDNYRPYSYAENNKAKGVYIDVLQAVFDKMTPFDVNMVPVAWPRGKQIMEQGKGYGLAPAFFHGHDWPYLYPYSLHFYIEKIAVYCHPSVLIKKRVNWPDDYKGLHIVNIAGFDGWGGKKFRRMIDQKLVKYSEVRGMENMLLMVSLGRADCLLSEEGAFNAINEQLLFNRIHSANGRYKALKKVAISGEDPVYIGYSEVALKEGKYPFHNKFSKMFDSELYKLKKSGEVYQIMQKSFTRH
ncbi:transporter substrate-binding domain-containing protein [Zooshikella marina]|uniref:substrate-binding periplasmic protein n=1 Tax=Zooshikella ganghwensis TaxID=202772 RepID=UPI001BB04467|nr:transporter substrate-binding domain-containing protein [Zooshikella ganghwensis]MBU2705666.1 transporter substrate-binding domain-containing protein [Zooshikella ganghwensis]